MSEGNGRLGPQEQRLLRELAGSGMRLFRTEEAYPYFASKARARKALSRLESKGWLMRLERGLYLIVPLEAGPEGMWAENPLAIAHQLTPVGAVGYLPALHYWEMTKQAPAQMVVQTLRRRFRPRVTILGVQYQFVLLVERKLFGVTTQTIDGLTFRITDREKTLVDACDRPDLCGGAQGLVEALLSSAELDWGKVDTYLDRMRSGAIYKRLGYLVDSLDIAIPDLEWRLDQWRRSLSEGIALLEPGRKPEGPVHTAWRVRVNAKVKVGEVVQWKSEAVTDPRQLTSLPMVTAVLEAVGLEEQQYGFHLRYGSYAPEGVKSEIKVGGLGLVDFSKRTASWFTALGATELPLRVVDEGTGELTVHLMEVEPARLEEHDA
jgi:predicted transcriptional regulator of viral defense system